MGSWGNYQSENLDEVTAGNGDATAEINLNPGEKAQFFVTRTDGATNGDPWRVAVEGNVEDTPDWAENPPLWEWRLLDTQLEISFVVAGPYSLRIKVQNDDIGDFDDVVTATVGWRKDGVSI